MLVLSREVDESIVIGDDIVITVLAIEGDRVKLGVSAPRQIPVLRKELWQAIREQEAIAQQLETHPESEAVEALRKLLVEEGQKDEPDPSA